jgi:hypothetical protein
MAACSGSPFSLRETKSGRDTRPYKYSTVPTRPTGASTTIAMRSSGESPRSIHLQMLVPTFSPSGQNVPDFNLLQNVLFRRRGTSTPNPETKRPSRQSVVLADCTSESKHRSTLPERLETLHATPGSVCGQYISSTCTLVLML